MPKGKGYPAKAEKPKSSKKAKPKKASKGKK